MNTTIGNGSTLGRSVARGIVFSVLAVAATGAAAFGACPNGADTGERLQSGLVGASYTSDGITVTYTFDSLVDRSPGTDGVPGLVSYCVYPPSGIPSSATTDALGADGTPFEVDFKRDSFAFTRGNGNDTNIPLDGTTGITIGTATWDDGAPSTQTILLHINDAEECDRLYGGNPGTCYVFPSPAPDAQPLTVLKDATPAFDRRFTWNLDKSVDKTLVEQVGGTATFTYTVAVTHDAGTDSDWVVRGSIVVANPNAFAVTADISDAIDNGGDCTVVGGDDAVIPGGSVGSPFGYTCTYGSAPNPASGTNTATVTWDRQGALAAGSASYSVAGIDFAATTPSLRDGCVTVDDTYTGGLGSVCVGDANPRAFVYPRTVNVPQWNCQFYANTATYTASTSGDAAADSVTVEVCGPANTGALTMGFWQNKNGQALITGQAATGVCPSGVYLRQYAPFQDLSATATCKQVAAYVTAVIKAANASGTSMNAMLKAQMLATALDVHFISGPSGPIGGIAIDLTHICKTIGGGACTGGYQDVSSAFGGSTSLTVSAILSYAASQSNAGGSLWYGQVKAVQELAKNTFDAINNQVAFAP